MNENDFKDKLHELLMKVLKMDNESFENRLHGLLCSAAKSGLSPSFIKKETQRRIDEINSQIEEGGAFLGTEAEGSIIASFELKRSWDKRGRECQAISKFYLKLPKRKPQPSTEPQPSKKPIYIGAKSTDALYRTYSGHFESNRRKH